MWLCGIYFSYANFRSFFTLAQHRFASHTCESILTKAALAISQDPILSSTTTAESIPNENEHEQLSMEVCILNIANELEVGAAELITQPYGSHVLRLMILVLSGQPLESSRFPLRSKRAEPNEGKGPDEEPAKTSRYVPASFNDALQRVIHQCLAVMDTTAFHEAALEPVANPLLQLILRVEFAQYGKQHLKDEGSILRKFLPDDLSGQDSESLRFINTLLYDKIGSRLLEVIIECAPASLFKQVFKEVFRDTAAELAQDDVASYVLAKVLERVGKDDLKHMHDALLPVLPPLAHRGRVHLVQTLVERCAERGLDTKELARTITFCWPEEPGESLSLAKMLAIEQYPAEGDSTTPQNKATPFQSRTSLVAQAVTKVAGPLSNLVFNALSTLTSPACLLLAYSPTFSPILQVSLTVKHAPIIYRRKLITRFYSHAFALATDVAGSHLIDAIWHGTSGMAFVRERIAEELAENEVSLRENYFGRKVWKNWKMDMYRRRRTQWVTMVRSEIGNDGFQSFPDGTESPRSKSRDGPSAAGPSSSAPAVLQEAAAKPKTKIELARERFVKTQAMKQAGPVSQLQYEDEHKSEEA